MEEEPKLVPRKGRPKGSKNKPKRGRPKKPKTTSDSSKKTKKSKLADSSELEDKLDQALTRHLDDDKLTEAGYNTSTEKIINQEPVDPSFYYRGSKHVPVAGAQYKFTAAMVEELRKCKEDIIYFAENFFYIVSLDRGKEKIQLYEAQKKVLRSFVAERNVIVCSSRQIGKSTMLTVFSLWMVCFHDDYRAAIVANKETTAINIFKRIRLAYEQLPNYIKPGVKDYGKTGMTLGNDASIIVSTTTATSIRGDSLNCVAGKTEITLLTNKGALQTRSIEDLCVDDLVANTKELKILTKSGWSTFAGFKRTKTTKQLYTISTAHSTLTCTEDHLIFVDPLTTKQANELSIGDLIFCKDGRVAIESITICGTTNDWVYDVIETQDNSFWANDICVHNCVLLDEAAHIEQHLLEDFWSSVIPTISSGKKSKILVVSTPKGVGNKFYEIYSGAESGKLKKWKHERIDWWDVPGRDEEWKQEQIELLGSEEKFLQEYNNTFLDDAANAVGAQVLEKFKREKRPPIWTSEDGEYQVFDYPNPNRLYVIGVDVSEGIGRAASVAQILDVTDLQNITQVGVFGSARIEPYHFANKLNIIGNSWGKPPMLIERNNCGAQVIDALYHKHQYEKIVSHSKVSEQDRYNRTRSMGVLSHNNIRFDGIQNMRYWINHLDAVHINDANTISEFETFVKFPNGVFRKKSDNFFDDRVMSLVWALFILESEICAQYFEIIDYDTQHKPLAIKDNGYWENLPESYELKDLSIAPKVIAKPENYVAQSSPNFNSSELSILKIEEQFDEDVDSLLSQGYSFFAP